MRMGRRSEYLPDRRRHQRCRAGGLARSRAGSLRAVHIGPNGVADHHGANQLCPNKIAGHAGAERVADPAANTLAGIGEPDYVANLGEPDCVADLVNPNRVAGLGEPDPLAVDGSDGHADGAPGLLGANGCANRAAVPLTGVIQPVEVADGSPDSATDAPAGFLGADDCADDFRANALANADPNPDPDASADRTPDALSDAYPECGTDSTAYISPDQSLRGHLVRILLRRSDSGVRAVGLEFVPQPVRAWLLHVRGRVHRRRLRIDIGGALVGRKHRP